MRPLRFGSARSVEYANSFSTYAHTSQPTTRRSTSRSRSRPPLVVSRTRGAELAGIGHGPAHDTAHRSHVQRRRHAPHRREVLSCASQSAQETTPTPIGEFHWGGSSLRKATFLSMNYFFGDAGYYQQTTTKPRSLLHSQLPNPLQKMFY